VLLACSCARGPTAAPPQPLAAPTVAPDRGEPEVEPVALTPVERVPPELSPALTKGFADACGSCHDSRLGTAEPEALAIFDLADPRWLLDLPEERRACTLDRLGGKASVTAAAKTDLARILDQLREG
jgi:hypothetical protein